MHLKPFFVENSQHELQSAPFLPFRWKPSLRYLWDTSHSNKKRTSTQISVASQISPTSLDSLMPNSPFSSGGPGEGSSKVPHPSAVMTIALDKSSFHPSKAMLNTWICEVSGDRRWQTGITGVKFKSQVLHGKRGTFFSNFQHWQDQEES